MSIAIQSSTQGRGETAGGRSWALVVDDHPLFCDALELTLRSVTELTDIRTAGTLAAAIEALGARKAPTLVVLDLNLPDVAGLDGLVRLKAQAGCPVIVVSSMTDNATVHAALAAGASGFIPKHSSRTVIRDAIAQVRAGRTFRPDGFVEPEEAQDGTVDASVRLASLTNQQSRILGLICEGKLNKQIAYELSIAETTVKAHVTAIMRKLGVQSRTQAVLVAQSAQLSDGLQKGL